MYSIKFLPWCKISMGNGAEFYDQHKSWQFNSMQNTKNIFIDPKRRTPGKGNKLPKNPVLFGLWTAIPYLRISECDCLVTKQSFLSDRFLKHKTKVWYKSFACYYYVKCFDEPACLTFIDIILAEKQLKVNMLGVGIFPSNLFHCFIITVLKNCNINNTFIWW